MTEHDTLNIHNVDAHNTGLSKINNSVLRDKAYNYDQHFVIAIDGPSAAGKGTIAKLLGKKFQMQPYASSIFYRRLASLILQQNIGSDDILQVIKLSADNARLADYNPDNIYTEQVTSLTSKIAVIPQVRANLRQSQRLLIEQHKRIVLDGRDIGTVIAPNADLKLFITANTNARATRRYAQLRDNGVLCNFTDIYNSLLIRDNRDEQRNDSPLKPAADAIIFDSSDLDAVSLLTTIIAYIDHH